MPVYFSSLFGSASIGVYALATDKIVIIPSLVPIKKAERFEEWLKVKLIHTTIGGSILAGALACANSNGILLPHIIRDEELEAISAAFDGKVTIMETRKTAYGNMVLANDYGAVVDPRLKAAEVKMVSETLGVEAVPGEIAGLPYVGALAAATNKGVLAHPLLKDSERKLLEDVLKVPVDVGTINCGIPYVGTGLICNSYAAVAGALTTGPEMFIIGNALDVVEESKHVENLQNKR
ncbi:MAG: translation initiation factor IF-6 [Candidatus Bathyarchaeia archaeon]|nr:MAG: translation initiation factor IF-6 [Candidatus Bathyarchaeota archaeon]